MDWLAITWMALGFVFSMIGLWLLRVAENSLRRSQKLLDEADHRLREAVKIREGNK